MFISPPREIKNWGSQFVIGLKTLTQFIERFYQFDSVTLSFFMYLVYNSQCVI